MNPPGSEPRIALPPPRWEDGYPLARALAARRSRREFGPGPLELGEVGDLLWATLGLQAAGGRRTVPSAGALYPLEATLVARRVAALPVGLYRYAARGHALLPRAAADLGPRVRDAALWQDVVVRAAALIALIGVPERTRAKYGDRAERYVWMEAGHAGQNAYLQATALGLGVVALGAFRDAELAKALELSAGEVPLYLIAIGRG